MLHLARLARRPTSHSGDHVHVARRPIHKAQQTERGAADGDQTRAVAVGGQQVAKRREGALEGKVVSHR